MATAKVTRGPAVEAVYASGTVEPVSWAKVQPLRTGRIASVEAFEGDEVKTGQILMRLDDRELRASVAQLEAEQRFLRSELDRVSELARRGVTTTQVEERARSQLDQAVATLNAARQRVEDFLLRAPMDGTVLRRDGEVGEIARPEDVLFWIGRASPLRIEAEVDEEDIPLVAVGQPALIKADAFAGPDSGRHRRRHHAEGRSGQQELSRSHRPAAGYAAEDRHDGGIQHRGAAGRRGAAGAAGGRCRAATSSLWSRGVWCGGPS